MPRSRTVPVSITPEAREALRELAVEATIASRSRVTMSDALVMALPVVKAHRDELAPIPREE